MKNDMNTLYVVSDLLSVTHNLTYRARDFDNRIRLIVIDSLTGRHRLFAYTAEIAQLGER